AEALADRDAGLHEHGELVGELDDVAGADAALEPGALAAAGAELHGGEAGGGEAAVGVLLGLGLDLALLARPGRVHRDVVERDRRGGAHAAALFSAGWLSSAAT